MTPLKHIGYWQTEDPWNRYVHPKDLGTESNPEIREKVATYLDAGTEFVRFRGISMCRMCPSGVGSGEVTDGVWVWPDGLSHYVRDHHVYLPADFVAHVLHNEPKPRTFKEDYSLRSSTVYWEKWCKERAQLIKDLSK